MAKFALPVKNMAKTKGRNGDSETQKNMNISTVTQYFLFTKKFGFGKKKSHNLWGSNFQNILSF